MNVWTKGTPFFSDWWFQETDKQYKDAIKECKPKQVILPAGNKYTLEIDYPLSKSFTVKIDTGEKGMTREDVVELIVNSYKEIYENDEQYGVWGHEFGDLILAYLVVDGHKLSTVVDS